MIDERYAKAVMDLEDAFEFECRPGLDCFTTCCRDITIFLAPYDVIRLRKALDLGSAEFLEKHTHQLQSDQGPLPLVVLNMSGPDKSCPFVTEQGCSVYENRPWSCRLYPLDLDPTGNFTYIAGPERCLGLTTGRRIRIHQWLQDQDVVFYQDMNLLYAGITSHPKLIDLDIENPQVKRMIHMATYDLDAFRDFVFGSSFIQKFDIDDKRIWGAQTQDVELMKLGLDWIKFGLFGEPTLKIRDQVRAAYTARDKQGADQ